MQLSVLIVNYNVKFFLEQCLHSVQKAIVGIDAEILVIDNHSTDGSREYLSPKFPSVQFIWETENHGFGKANNKLISLAKGEYLLFLNPDTIVPEDCFSKCLQFYQAQKKCGAVGIRMIDGAGFFLKESKRSFPSPLTSFYKMCGLASLFPQSKTFAKYYAVHLPEHESGAVEVLAGACMLVSKQILEKVTGFDEQFFMYAEDIDLSYRISLAGFQNYYFAGTCCIHFKGESTQRKDPVYRRRFYGAMKQFVNKHYAGKPLIKFGMNIAVALGKSVASVRMLLPGKAHGSVAPGLLVLASQPYFNEVIQLIKMAKTPRIIDGRIALNDNDRQAAVGRMSAIQSEIKKLKSGELLFCTGDITINAMIDCMQELKGEINFLIHACGSASIVGSARSDGNGISISGTSLTLVN